MIKFHLKKILEKENLSINQVSHDTGINRASLTSMSNNSISMVRLETLDTLCNYFTIELAELITFIPDDYIVQVPLQPKNGEWIYALATRKPIIENSEKNGVMYNADLNEIPFIVYLPEKYAAFSFCSVGMPIRPVKTKIEKELNFDFKKTKKWLDFLTKEQALNICKQVITVFLNKYAKRKNIEILSVMFNADNVRQEVMSSFVFNVNKNSNGELSLELLKSV